MYKAKIGLLWEDLDSEACLVVGVLFANNDGVMQWWSKFNTRCTAFFATHN